MTNAVEEFLASLTSGDPPLFGPKQSAEVRYQLEGVIRTEQARAVRFAADKLAISTNVAKKLGEIADAIERGDVEVP